MELKITNLDKLIKISEKYPSISERHINNTINVSLNLLKGILRSNSPIGTSSDLREQWQVKVGRFEGTLTSNAQSDGFYYGSAVNFGTRPHWLPIKAIEPWAKKRGINPYALQKSIAKKGTKGQFFVEKTVNYAEKQIDKLFSKALNDIIKDITK